MKLLFTFLSLTLVLPQSRDAAPQRPTGTATLSGTVVSDDASARPIARATVTVSAAGNARNQLIAATDDNGRFTFSALPTGNVTVVASKPGYVTTYYGARKTGATVGVPIALVDGQQLTGLALRMARGAVVTGTVLDENGRPMTGAPVRLRQVIVSASNTRSFGNIFGVAVPSTDDRGMYRIFGLPPGDYVVSVQPRATGTGELRQATSAELQWAEQQVQGSTAGGPAIGAAPQPTPPPGKTVTYANVFYPGTTDESAATLITVAQGQERAGIDIRAQLVPTARLEGTVLDPNGQPAAGVQVTLLPQEAASPGAASDLARQLVLLDVGLVAGAGAARTNPAGAFTLAGVPPGGYTLMASTARPGAARGGLPTPASPGLWAMTNVSVSGDDISNIAMTLAPGMTVSGKFVFSGKTSPPDQSRVTVMVTTMQSSGASVVGIVTVNPADPAFSVTGLAPGRYRIGATMGGWTLASATLGGRDVADTPFEIKPGQDVSDLVVTFTDEPAQISGHLMDSTGRPAPSLVLLLFPTDRSLWYQGSRRLRAPVSPASDGTFTFTGVVPGEYYLAAVTDVSPTDWFDPAFLDQVALSAIKAAVGPGEKKTWDVKVGR